LFSFSVVAMLFVSISLVDLLDELPSIIIYVRRVWWYQRGN
jgi:hypothetical protein